MAPTYWILLAAALIVVAAVAFLLGRKTARGEARARDLEHELERTRHELASVREGVSDHFEQSARIFGRLAGEYRAFYEHFTETARELGISERRASELLQQADPGRVGDQSDVVGENDDTRSHDRPDTASMKTGGEDAPAATAADTGAQSDEQTIPPGGRDAKPDDGAAKDEASTDVASEDGPETGHDPATRER